MPPMPPSPTVSQSRIPLIVSSFATVSQFLSYHDWAWGNEKPPAQQFNSIFIHFILLPDRYFEVATQLIQ